MFSFATVNPTAEGQSLAFTMISFRSRLLQTRRVIRQEAALVFDSHNEFYFVNAGSWKW
jgi:hypothetical protein